jgi:hypothetical protein
VPNDDPFEKFRERREIEIMERGFKVEAERRQQDEHPEEPDPEAEQDEKIRREMEDFLCESTQSLERVLGEISDSVDEEEIGEILAQDREGNDSPPPAPPVWSEPEKKKPVAAEPEPPAAPPEPPPQPSIVERRPLGAPEEEQKPLDLKAALERIRKHRGGAAPAAPAAERAPAPPPPAPEPPPPFEPAPPPEPEPRAILTAKPPNVDDPPRPVLSSPMDMLGNAPAPAFTPDPPPEPPAAPPSEPLMRDPAFETPPSPPGDAAGDLEGPGLASTNVFEAEPGEDDDLDEGKSGGDPGWDLPPRPTPPGAWVVAKQKEQGDAGLTGAAGDTYLIKKLCQEVRQLNRLYQVLLDKNVVTREEVEGPGAAGRDGGDEGDDDEVGVDDYNDTSYRPIITTETDFSLSGLVKDMHRLKVLKEVLVKKGVVSAKELDKFDKK